MCSNNPRRRAKHFRALGRGGQRNESNMTKTSTALKAICLCLSLLGGCASIYTPQIVQKTGEPVSFTPDGDFSEFALRNGVRATQDACRKVQNAVWVTSEELGNQCLRYWAAGFSEYPSKRAVVYFPGDAWIGAGRTPKNYLEMTSSRLQESAEIWSKRLGAPYIFFARPGTYGSTGDHMQRRRVAESQLVSKGLDVLKERLGIAELVVVGQSGGGHVTSALLTHRSDIVCAVPTSAPSSPRVRWTQHHWATDSTGYRDSYEPTKHLHKDHMHVGIRVFVVGDPQDLNVVWDSQTILADKLREIEIPTSILPGTAAGNEHHDLSTSGRTVAGWCAHDMPTDEMLRRATNALRG